LPPAAAAGTDERPSHVQYGSSAKLNKEDSPEELGESGIKVELIDVSVEKV